MICGLVFNVSLKCLFYNFIFVILCLKINKKLHYCFFIDYIDRSCLETNKNMNYNINRKYDIIFGSDRIMDYFCNVRYFSEVDFLCGHDLNNVYQFELRDFSCVFLQLMKNEFY